MVERPPGDGPDRHPGQEPGGNLRPTSAAVLTGWAVAGLVLGWVLHPLSEQVNGTAPVVGWSQPGVLAVVAGLIGGTAWLTWRAVHVHRLRLEPHQAVNRLVLARACAFVGALVAGGYAGYAVSWVGIDSELARQRLLRSAVAALASAAIVVAGLLLERACRVRSGDPEP